MEIGLLILIFMTCTEQVRKTHRLSEFNFFVSICYRRKYDINQLLNCDFKQVISQVTMAINFKNGTMDPMGGI